jgi:hypothetical protein
MACAQLARPASGWAAHRGVAIVAIERARGAALSLDTCSAQHMVRSTAVLRRLTDDEENAKSLLGLQRLHIARWRHQLTPDREGSGNRRRSLAFKAARSHWSTVKNDEVSGRPA